MSEQLGFLLLLLVVGTCNLLLGFVLAAHVGRLHLNIAWFSIQISTEDLRAAWNWLVAYVPFVPRFQVTEARHATKQETAASTPDPAPAAGEAILDVWKEITPETEKEPIASEAKAAAPGDADYREVEPTTRSEEKPAEFGAETIKSTIDETPKETAAEKFDEAPSISSPLDDREVEMVEPAISPGAETKTEEPAPTEPHANLKTGEAAIDAASPESESPESPVVAAASPGKIEGKVDVQIESLIAAQVQAEIEAELAGGTDSDTPQSNPAELPKPAETELSAEPLPSFESLASQLEGDFAQLRQELGEVLKRPSSESDAAKPVVTAQARRETGVTGQSAASSECANHDEPNWETQLQSALLENLAELKAAARTLQKAAAANSANV